jgi:peptidyl-prolyl cis-trans isomerase A (cyclophilin A)
MLIRFAPLALLLASPALSQDVLGAPAPPPLAPVPVAPQPGAVRVTLRTAEGPILLELDKDKAPITAANFLRYVDGHRLDGTSFYRAVKVGQGYGLLQGGLRNDPKKLFPPIPHEPTTTTGLSHVAGTISMARAAPGTATADFFIVVGDLTALDADPTKPGDNQGFAAFGHVVSGMDIVSHMLEEPTSATAGPAVMKGQMLDRPVKIISAKRTE